MSRPRTLFVSDVHLDPNRPATTVQFVRLLDQLGTQAEALYILGDLLEYWLGDDEPETEVHCAFHALRDLGKKGTRIYFMHGNRDFLIGSDFLQNCGCELIPDPSVVDLYGTPTLLMHGDTLCTDDVDYQAFRKMVRAPEWQKAFLQKPLEERRAMAQNLRTTSAIAMQAKSAEIINVNTLAVEAALKSAGVQRLIHGHTHRPGLHQWSLEGRTATRLVLGDWYKQGQYIECDAQGCRLKDYPKSG